MNLPCPVCSQGNAAGIGASVICSQCGTEFEVVEKLFGGERVPSSEVRQLRWRRACDFQTSLGRVAMVADGSGTEAAVIACAMPLELAVRDYLRRFDCCNRPWLAAALYMDGVRVDGLWFRNDGCGWHVTQRSLKDMAEPEVDLLCDQISALAMYGDYRIGQAWRAVLGDDDDIGVRELLVKFLAEYETRAGRPFEL